MFCPKCGNTVGYTKVTETSKPIELKGLTTHKAIKKTEIEGVFFNNGPIEIICNNCGNNMEEDDEEE